MSVLPAKYRRDRTLDYNHKYVHDECSGTSRKLYVKFCRKNGQLGWLYHCFSCQNSPGGLRGFHPVDQAPSPSETLSWVKQFQSKNSPYRGEQSVRLPDDFTTLLDQKAIKYLMKYQITLQEAKQYGLGYSAGLDRMIIPVYTGDRLVSYQARTFHLPYTKYTPKYITIQARDIKHCIYRPLNPPETEQLVLVEAALSVIKLGRIVDCFGLLGSSLDQSVYPYLKGREVLIWLDPDKNIESIKFAKHLRALINPNVKSILTKRKPKCYSISVVEKILKGEQGL